MLLNPRTLFLCLWLISEASAAQEMPESSEVFQNLEYRSIGPAAGGRVSRAVGVVGDRNTYYQATASGGVWKSTDGGVTWKPILDEHPVSSIGSIAVAASDANVVYVGAGEANIRGNVASGNGIYRSTDAGATWEHVWDQEGQIGTLEVHPTNADIAFAAVLGRPFGPNPERGVYRTMDGGDTWERVLFANEDTGASDVSISHQNPRVVFAGLWQARRSPWDLTSGGPDGGVFVSRDGGDTWKKIETGLPSGLTGKIAVDVAASDGERVYALIEAADDGGLYRSDDGGKSFELVNRERYLLIRPWYFVHLTVHPTNPDVVWAPSLRMLESIDGGHTFKQVKGIHHGDHHDLWIDPNDPRRMIASNDGGVDISVDGGESWYAPMLPISQFYRINVDDSVPYRVTGNMQDLGTASGPSNSLSTNGITRYDWHGVGGGETGHTVSDPRNPDIVYAGEYFGYLSRYNHASRQARNIAIYPMDTSGQGAAELRYRFQWTAPVLLSPHDPDVLYHGAQYLMRTQDAGMTWEAVSPDLTRDDESKQQFAGGPITGDNTGVEIYGTIFAIAESPLEPGVLWVGSDDGLVHLSIDNATEWVNVTPTELPEWSTITTIEPSYFDAGTAWLVAERHRLDDMRPYLYVTTDYGKTWSSLTADLPQDVYLHTVREDPDTRGLLFAGTELGVVFSKDAGKSWESLQLNLPPVAVHELRVKNGDLVVGTHGRSVWILDDLTPIRETSREIMEASIHLFSARDAVRFRYHRGPRDIYSGDNPPEGAIIHYFLKNELAEDDNVEMRILGTDGTVVRHLTSEEQPPPEAEDHPDPLPHKVSVLPKKQGINRFVWDFRWDGAKKIPGAEIDMGDPGIGAMAVPRDYVVELTVGGETLSTDVALLPDPRVEIAEDALDEQLRFSLSIRDAITELSETVIEIQSVREQLERLRERELPEALSHAARDILDKGDAVESRLHNPEAEVAYDILATRGGAKLYSKLGPLMDYVNEGDGAPTQGMREVFDELRSELSRAIADWRAVVDEDLASFNARAREVGIPLVGE